MSKLIHINQTLNHYLKIYSLIKQFFSVCHDKQFFLFLQCLYKGFRAQNIRNRIWPKHPTLTHWLAKAYMAKTLALAKTSYIPHVHAITQILFLY